MSSKQRTFNTGKFGLNWDQVQRWRNTGMGIIATDGCFDLLHVGHLRMLRWAAAYTDKLVVLLPDDASVAAAKPGRPFVELADRAELVSGIEGVDAVGWYPQAELADLYAKLRPDVMVNSSDWTGKIIGQAEVEEAGGRIVFFPTVSGHSTSDIVSKIRAAP